MRSRTLTVKESIKELFQVPNLSDARINKRCIRDAKLHKVGTCSEYSDLVLNFLSKQPVNSAEVVSIIDGDHVFVVINRDLNSDINSPEKWGDQAIICDAWANDCYPATEIYKQLKCHHFEHKDHGSYTTTFQKYNNR